MKTDKTPKHDSSQRFLRWLIHLNVMTGHSSLFTCLYRIIMSLRGLVIKRKSAKVPELVSSRSDGAMALGRISRRLRKKKKELAKSFVWKTVLLDIKLKIISCSCWLAVVAQYGFLANTACFEIHRHNDEKLWQIILKYSCMLQIKHHLYI